MAGAKRPKPQNLTITVRSEPHGLVDLEILVKRGGGFSIQLFDGEENEEAFKLPIHPRDQRRWVCDVDGMRPLHE